MTTERYGGRRRSVAFSRRLRLGLCALVGLFAVRVLRAQIQGPPVRQDPPPAQGPNRDSKEEEVAKVDPYTKGEREAFDKAGYYSLGPFPLATGMQTRDVEEILGGIPVLWVETEHFRLGSTLGTYRFAGDAIEERKIGEELKRLSKRLPRCKTSPTKLDPWLRLHLYAQRLEEQYADFLSRFGFDDAEFRKPAVGTKPGEPGYMGEGPYLGQESKFVVLLFEKSSAFGRFVGLFPRREDAPTYRECLPGGAMLLCTSAQAWRDLGYDLDATLHCAVAAELASNLVDGFRKSWFAAPLWFRLGLAHAYSRRADERWTIFATGTMREVGDDSWRWAPRIRGLVANKAAISWRDMLAMQQPAQIKSHDHMVLWSRVDWLSAQKDADLHSLLLAFTDSLQAVPEADRPKVSLERQVQAFQAAFGKTPDELEEAWRRHVLSRYARD